MTAGALERMRMPAPVSAIVLGIATGTLVLLLTRHNPIDAYWTLLVGALGPQNIPDMLNWAFPIVGMALVAAVPMRSGVLNLGGDGQLVIGGMVAAMLPLLLPAAVPGPVTVVIALVAAMVASGSYALIAAWGEIARGIPMLVSSLLLQYPAIGVTAYLGTFALRDRTSTAPQTPLLPDYARLPELVGGVNSGGILIVLLLILIVFVDRRTTTGYEARMTGLNRRFAEYGGIRIAQQTYRLMFVSGAIAGLVGAIVVLGSHHRFIVNALTSPGYGPTGFMASLLSNGEPLGAAAAGLFFAVLQTGGLAMQRQTDVPRVLATVLQAMIILFLALRRGFGRKDG